MTQRNKRAGDSGGKTNEQALIEAIGWVLTHYELLQGMAAKKSLPVEQFLNKSVRLLDREPSTPIDPDNFVDEWISEPLSYEDTRALYKRISKFFAKKGTDATPASVLKKRGQDASRARWGKTTE